MELKRVWRTSITILRLLLIVPYGIETDVGHGVLSLRALSFNRTLWN